MSNDKPLPTTVPGHRQPCMCGTCRRSRGEIGEREYREYLGAAPVPPPPGGRHTTHFEDCGCVTAALRAECERLRAENERMNGLVKLSPAGFQRWRELFSKTKARTAAAEARLDACRARLDRVESLLTECADSMEARPEDPGLQTMARAARRALDAGGES